MLFDTGIKTSFKFNGFNPKNNNPSQSFVINHKGHSQNWKMNWYTGSLQILSGSSLGCSAGVSGVQNPVDHAYSTRFVYALLTNLLYDVILDISIFFPTSRSIRRRSALIMACTLSHLVSGDTSDDGLHYYLTSYTFTCPSKNLLRHYNT